MKMKQNASGPSGRSAMSTAMLAFVFAAPFLAGCNKAANEPAKPKPDTSTPEYACSSDETKEAVKQLVIQKAGEFVGKDKTVLDRPDLMTAIGLNLIVVDSVDAATKKVSCKAQLSLTAPEAVRAQLSQNNVLGDYMRGQFEANAATVPPELVSGDGRSVTIKYDRQPSAEGDQFVYTLYDAEPLGVAVARVAQVLRSATKNDAQGASAPASKEAQVFRRTRPTAGELTLTQAGDSWRVEITAAGLGEGGAVAADCTIEAQGVLSNGAIDAKYLPDYIVWADPAPSEGYQSGKARLKIDGDTVTVVSADTASCGLNSDLTGRYERVKR